MSGRGPQSYKKKLKEQQRKEKQQGKMAKRLERKRQPESSDEPLPQPDGGETSLNDGDRSPNEAGNPAPVQPVQPPVQPVQPPVQPVQPIQPEPAKSLRPSPVVSIAAGAGRPVPQKAAASKDYKTVVRSYRFQRAQTSGIIEVLNENSYVMAEYSERTGAVKWQRMVLASQREQIEKWLQDHYRKA